MTLGPDNGSLHELAYRRRLTVHRVIFSLLVSLAVVLGLLQITKVSPTEILARLSAASPWALLAGFLLHILAYWLRALRFRILIGSKKVGLTSLFDIMTVHNLMNHVLPFRAGELTYVYLVHQTDRVPLGEGLGTLAVARIMELVAFCVYCSLSVVWLRLARFRFAEEYDPYVWAALWSIVPLLLALIALLCLLALKGVPLVKGVRQWALRGALSRARPACRLFDAMERAALSFAHLRSRRVRLAAFALSLAIMGIVYLVAYVLLSGIGYPMIYPLVVVCSTIAGLVFMLPLYGLGGLGTVETGWTLGCLMAGVPKTTAVASGFSFHIIVLGYVSLLGIYGIVRLGRSCFGPTAPGVGRSASQTR